MQAVVIAYQVEQRKNGYQYSGMSLAPHKSATESRFLDIFGVMMNGALVPVIVCLTLSPVGTPTLTLFSGHLSRHHYCPRRFQFITHGARAHSAPRIPSDPLHCSYNQPDRDKPS